MAQTVLYYSACLFVAVNLITLCSTGMKGGKGGCGVKVVAIETIKFKKVPVMYPEESSMKMYKAKSVMSKMEPMPMMMMPKMTPMMMMGGGGWGAPMMMGGGGGWGSPMGMKMQPMGMMMGMKMGKKG